MENNHYTPPTSAVADIPASSQGPAPGKTVLAVRLLWLSLLLALPSFYLSVERSPSGAATTIAVIFQLVIFALVAYLNVSILRCRNWARIVSLVLTILGLLFVALVPNPPDITVVERLIAGLSSILDLAAMYLLFTEPSSVWFKSGRP